MERPIYTAGNGVRQKFQTAERINVVIVDDHEIVRAGLKQALEREPDIAIIGDARTGHEAVPLHETPRQDATRVSATATTGNNGKPGAALSERDVAIIRYVAGGLTNKEIASLVHLSSHTIKDRLEKIASTFDVRSRAEIVAEAFRAGLI